MHEGTRREVVSIVEAASEAVQESLRGSIPGVSLKCGHYRNPTIELFVYATFTSASDVVSLCVGVQAAGDGYHIVGDICHEEGRVVRDVVDCFVDSDEMIVRMVREYGGECLEQVEAIAEALRGDRR